MPDRHLVVVAHTHWDREWYLTHETFRYRLVGLLDGVLDLLERDPAFRHFTLDGQTIVLSDYLEVRPGARERIAKLVREGRLLVGPWFVLPDEWLVSGEALVRNLRRGLADARELGAVMRVGYVPDQFGHVGQLPQLLAGFGCESAALWRGVPAEIDESLFEWEAPDGTRVFTAYLMHGYGNAVHLPLDPDALAGRLRAEGDRLAARSRIPSLLLMNGSDHVAPQPGLPAALAAAVAKLPGTHAEIGTLPGFLARARREASGTLPLHRGELRSGLRSPLLEGCASARMPQKRADFLNDRLLTRYLEPLAAWLAALGGEADPAFLELAWRLVLENHPHDSICGCSIDAVHQQMDARFARASDIAQAHLRRVAGALGRCVAAPEAGFGRGAGSAIAVWNPHASGLAEVEGEVEIDLGGARHPRLHVRDASGRRLPAVAELAVPGEVAASYTLAASGVAVLARGVPPEFMGLFVCALRWGGGARGRRVDVVLGGEKPADFDLDATKAELSAWLAAQADAPVTFRALKLPRWRLRFVDRLPGCGLRVYRIARGAARAEPALRAERLPAGGAAIENELVRIEAQADGRVRWIDRRSGSVVEDALRVVSEGDRGDEYNFDPVPRGERVERPARALVELGPVSEAELSLVIAARYRRAGRARRGPGCAREPEALAAGALAAAALARARARGGGDRRRQHGAGSPAARSRARPVHGGALRGGIGVRDRAAPDRARAARFWQRAARGVSDRRQPPTQLRHAVGRPAGAHGREPRLRGGRSAARERRVDFSGPDAAARRRLAIAGRSRVASDARGPCARDPGRPGSGPAPRRARLLAPRARRCAARRRRPPLRRTAVAVHGGRRFPGAAARWRAPARNRRSGGRGFRDRAARRELAAAATL